MPEPRASVNTFYHKLASGDWMNISNPGGPELFGVRTFPEDGLFYPSFTYGYGNMNWLRLEPGSNTVAAAQTALDSFMAQLNAGTIGP